MKTDYALRALLGLVEHYGQGAVSIRELAKRYDIPQRFLGQIMMELKERGIVSSVPGRDGGYVLARPPADITIGQIVRNFDGILAPIHCVSVTRYEACSQEAVCRFRRVLLGIRNHTARLMDSMTLAALACGEPVTEEEVFSEELQWGAGI